LLGQHVFQAVVCVSSAVQSVTLCTALDTHNFQRCILLIILQKCNFSKDHHKLPEDGPDGPKHVGAKALTFSL
jgi:hypothetical protein